MTIQFHVDDLCMSYMHQSALDDVVEQLNGVFKTSKKELLVTRGSVHDYLGLTIDFSEKNQMVFTMYDYIKDIVNTAPIYIWNYK